MKNMTRNSGLVWNVFPSRKNIPERSQTKNYRIEFTVPDRKEQLEFWRDSNVHSRAIRGWALMIDRLNHARDLYAECVETNLLVRGGVPVISGTRVPIATVLANIASDMSISVIADDLDLDVDKLTAFFQCISIAFDRPMNEYHSTRRVHELQEIEAFVCDGGKDNDSRIPEIPERTGD